MIARDAPATLDEWILRVMGLLELNMSEPDTTNCQRLGRLPRPLMRCPSGSGIADLYMRPYNLKVWAYPTTMLQAEWLADPTVRPMDLKEVVANVLHGKLQPAPKIFFKYPKVR